MGDNKNLKEQEEKIKPHRKRRTINYKKIAMIVAIILFLTMELISAWMATNPSSSTITLQGIYDLNDDGKIDHVSITKSSNTFQIYDTDGNVYICINPNNDTFIYDLMKNGINVEVQKQSLYNAVLDICSVVPMFIIFIMLVYYLSNTIIGASVKMFTLLDKSKNKVTFDDVAGMSEVKEEISNTTSMIRNYKVLANNGARPCKGILLYGPPGVGKTLLAKAIANDVNMPFISASGSDFAEMFVGVGAARVRSLWDLALQNAPCVLFIDEMDALGKRRGGFGGAEGEKNQTLNALLQRMDGLNAGNGVFVIAATNRIEDLDPALLRPGRFDKHIYIGKPRLKKDKEEVIQLYLKDKRVYEDVTLEKVSHLITDMSGAEIEDVLNNAVYNSIKRGDDGKINLKDIDDGIMSMYTDGVPVKISSEHDRKITAIHESGHTIMNLLLNRKVVKVSVIPYSSGVGGMTVTTDTEIENDKLRLNSDYIGDIKVLLAGMVAEEIMLGEHTQGAQNDIEKASGLVYNMVTSFAFSDTVFNTNVLVSNGMMQAVDKETLDSCNRELIKIKEDTFKIMLENMDYLRSLSDKLMETDTILYPTLEEIKSMN